MTTVTRKGNSVTIHPILLHSQLSLALYKNTLSKSTKEVTVCVCWDARAYVCVCVLGCVCVGMAESRELYQTPAVNGAGFSLTSPL